MDHFAHVRGCPLASFRLQNCFLLFAFAVPEASCVMSASPPDRRIRIFWGLINTVNAALSRNNICVIGSACLFAKNNTPLPRSEAFAESIFVLSIGHIGRTSERVLAQRHTLGIHSDRKSTRLNSSH